MKLYKNLDDYLGAPTERDGIIPQSFLEELLRDIADEPPLPFHERLIYDITCNQEVFQNLGFSQHELHKLSISTRLLPREILGINSLKVVLTHDPCMRKLAWHIEEKLDEKKKQHAREIMIRCAKIRHAIGSILSSGNIGDLRLKNILQPAIHYQICTALALPTD